MAKTDAVLNRVGIDGLRVTLPIETVSGDVLNLPSRVICMLSAQASGPLLSKTAELESLLHEELLQWRVNFSAMFETLHRIRTNYRSTDNYLKVGFAFPFLEQSYVIGLECQLMRNRLKSFLSVSFKFSGKIVVRITADIPPDTNLHAEEIISLIEEIYDPKEHKKMDRLVHALAQRLESYERIEDYLVLANQEPKRNKTYGAVVQEWKGIPGGLRPMPGLERSVPDI